MQCVAVCCSVLRCVAVCCSDTYLLQWNSLGRHCLSAARSFCLSPLHSLSHTHTLSPSLPPSLPPSSSLSLFSLSFLSLSLPLSPSTSLSLPLSLSHKNSLLNPPSPPLLLTVIEFDLSKPKKPLIGVAPRNPLYIPTAPGQADALKIPLIKRSAKGKVYIEVCDLYTYM